MQTKPGSLKPLSPSDVKAMMDQGKTPFFIDVRNQQDWADSDNKIVGAMRVSLSQLEQHLPHMPKFVPIVTYCN